MDIKVIIETRWPPARSIMGRGYQAHHKGDWGVMRIAGPNSTTVLLASAWLGASAPDISRAAGPPGQPSPTAPAPAAVNPSTPAADAPAMDQHITMRVLTDRSVVAPGGTLTLALDCKLTPPWHTYWPGVNDTGTPASFELTLPIGWSADAPRWPAPTRHVSPGDLLDHVLDGAFTVLVTVHVPAAAAPYTTHILRVHAEWLVCDKVCLMQETSGQASLRVGATPADDPSGKAAVDAATRQLPEESLPAGVEVGVKGGALSINWPGATAIEFLPLETGIAYTDLINGAVGRGSTLSIALDAQGATHAAGVVRATVRRAGMATQQTVTLRIPINGPSDPQKPTSKEK